MTMYETSHWKISQCGAVSLFPLFRAIVLARDGFHLFSLPWCDVSLSIVSHWSYPICRWIHLYPEIVASQESFEQYPGYMWRARVSTVDKGCFPIKNWNMADVLIQRWLVTSECLVVSIRFKFESTGTIIGGRIHGSLVISPVRPHLVIKSTCLQVKSEVNHNLNLNTYVQCTDYICFQWFTIYELIFANKRKQWRSLPLNMGFQNPVVEKNTYHHRVSSPFCLIIPSNISMYLPFVSHPILDNYKPVTISHTWFQMAIPL